MDIDGLSAILAKIDSGEIETLAIDTPSPSPMAHEILNANPYAFLDDAPLEERRARAVSLRRVDPWLGREFGQLDPQAIVEVCRQAWPEARDADELHDLLLGIGLLPVEWRKEWQGLARALIDGGRATIAAWQSSQGAERAYVAAERVDLIRAAIPEASIAPAIALPLGFTESVASPEEAVKKIVQGWLEVSGPVSAAALAARLGLARSQVDAGLFALESAGVAMRGQFTSRIPSGQNAEAGEDVEWCDRVLLARIHRLTLGKMRREVEPVAAADFIKFLIHWQHAAPGARLRGRDGVLRVIEQLQGLELPAPAWEQHVLPARIENYDPADLEYLCLAGMVAWGRLRNDTMPDDRGSAKVSPGKRIKRLLAPARNAPIAFLLRDELANYLEPMQGGFKDIPSLSAMALEVARYLEQHGASFLADIANDTGLLKVKVEEALWQLVAHGLASGDGIAGLRVLLTPENKRVQGRRRLRVVSGGRNPERAMPVGRWSLWRTKLSQLEVSKERRLERQARQLLQRYGVMFRDLLARESFHGSWRDLLTIYRRWEARGEIRGGRFINGFIGEQFALPEAVERLRELRRRQGDADEILIAAGDPLNFAGILTAGPRISPYTSQMIAYRNGEMVDSGLLGELVSRLQPSEDRKRT
jgi:ATP-dependent Lhr-like helicase